MKQDQDCPDIWSEVRCRWIKDDLPALLGVASSAVVDRLSERLRQRRWSTEDEG